MLQSHQSEAFGIFLNISVFKIPTLCITHKSKTAEIIITNKLTKNA